MATVADVSGPPRSSSNGADPATANGQWETRPIASSLEELLAALWPAPDYEAVWSRGRSTTQETYWILPTVHKPRLIVPVTPLEVAAAAVPATTGGPRITRWLRRSLRLALRAGLPERLPLITLQVHRRGSKTSIGFLDSLRGALHDPSLLMSIRLGAPNRQNQKPVLQLVAGDGTTLAFGKIGLNSLTRRLVAHEEHTLSSLAAHVFQTLCPPASLGLHKWRNIPVVLQEALPIPRDDVEVPRQMVVDAMREIEDTGLQSCEPLAASQYITALRGRLDTRDPGQAEALKLIKLVVDTCGRQRLRFGAWHGDFRQWNIAADGNRLLVWDWERYDRHVPAGLDAIHLIHTGPDANDGAAAYAQRLNRQVASSGPLLKRLDIPIESWDLLVNLHVLEVSVRALRDSMDTAFSPRINRRLETQMAAVALRLTSQTD